MAVIVRNEEIDNCSHWKYMPTYNLDTKREIIYDICVFDMYVVCDMFVLEGSFI